MLLSLVGCKKDPTAAPTSAPTQAPDATATTAPTEAPAPTTQPVGPFTPYDEPVKITVGRATNEGGKYVPGEDVNNNYIIRMLKDCLNIEVEIKFAVPAAQYDETLARYAADNNLPDVFNLTDSAADYSLYRDLIDAGRLTEVSGLYDGIVGVTKDYIRDNVNLAEIQTGVTVDGKVYSLHAGREGYNTGFLWIRQDWLDKLGLKVPQTIAELEDVALAFVDAKLGGNPDTTGLVFAPAPGGWSWQWIGILPLFNAFGSYPDIWIDDGNGGAKYGAVQPETKEALALLASWTEKGIISKAMLAMTSGDAARDTYIATDAAGIYFDAWWDPWSEWNGFGPAVNVETNPNVQWTPVLVPLNGEGKFAPKAETYGTDGLVILNTVKQPEAVVKAINFLMEVINFRNPELSDVYDKYLAPIVDIRDDRTANPFPGLVSVQTRPLVARAIDEYLDGAGLDALKGDPKYASLVEDDWFNVQGAYDYIKNGGLTDWYAQKDSLVEPEKPAEDAAADDPVLVAYNKFIAEKNALGLNRYIGYQAFYLGTGLQLKAEDAGVYQVKKQAFIGATDSFGEYWTALSDLRDTAFAQIISGSKPVDYFDEFVSQWHKLGGDLLTDEVNAKLKGN
jgi:putative aldouronate transport system substrate-binding protein